MLVLAEGIQKLGKWAAAVGKEGKPAIRHTTPTTSGDRRWSSLWLLACSALANTGGKRGGGEGGRPEEMHQGRDRPGRGTRWLGNGQGNGRCLPDWSGWVLAMMTRGSVMPDKAFLLAIRMPCGGGCLGAAAQRSPKAGLVLRGWLLCCAALWDLRATWLRPGVGAQYLAVCVGIVLGRWGGLNSFVPT